MHHLLFSWFVWPRSLYRRLQFLVLPPISIPSLIVFPLISWLCIWLEFFSYWYLRNAVIKRLKLLQASCRKMHQLGSDFPSSSTSVAEIDVEDFAMKHHKMALLRGRIEIERWEAHSHRWVNFLVICFRPCWTLTCFSIVRVSQCRMNKGLLLTGVGDKVWIFSMRFH